MRVVCTLCETIDDLGADQRIDQRGFAGIGRADQGDEAAARPGRCAWRVSDIRRARPRASSIAAAAACSAARLERPLPFGGVAIGQGYGDAEFGIVMRAGALDLASRTVSAGRAPAPIPASTVLGSRSGRAGLRIRSAQKRSTNALAAS